MAVDKVTAAHYRAQQTISRRTAQQAQLLWTNVEPKSVLASWRGQLAAMLGVLVRGQVAAASLANPYTEALAAAQEIPADALAAINPVAFAGTAADGRSLVSLLMQPALRTLGLLTKGADDQTALLSGLASLTRITATEIADASRAADHVGIVGTKTWVTYVRNVSLPACGRCIILAGREYSWSQGFQRHERCDCTMVPRREGDEPLATPEALFARMTPEEQARSFTIAGAEAIRLGADLGQVVNARRGMKTVGGRLLTTEGTTLRGFAGKRMAVTSKNKSPIRLMPEQILADANGDRDEAIRLLERFGYLSTPSPAVTRKRAEDKAAAEQARLESELAAEQARIGAEAAADRARVEAEAAAERARLEAEAAAEKARLEAEQARAEAERIEAERLEAERIEAERVAAEHAAAVASAKAAMAKSRALARAETKAKKEAGKPSQTAAKRGKRVGEDGRNAALHVGDDVTVSGKPGRVIGKGKNSAIRVEVDGQEREVSPVDVRSVRDSDASKQAAAAAQKVKELEAAATAVKVKELENIYGGQLRIQKDSKFGPRHVEDFVKIPDAFHEQLAKHGVKVNIGDGSVADLVPRMRGVQPRGWPPGKTWADVPGAYVSDDRHVIIGGGHGTGHGAISLCAHETGHAVDFALNDASSKQAFRILYGEALSEGLSPYYAQAGEAGQQEMWAESFAAWTLHRDDPPARRDAMIGQSIGVPHAKAAEVGGRLADYFSNLLARVEGH